MNVKDNPKFWIGMLLTIVSLVAIFYFIDIQEMWQAMREANLALLPLAVLGIIGHMILRAYRWRYILREKLPFMTVFHNQNIGYLLNQILPLRVGDLARGVLVGNTEEHEVPEVLSTVAVERVLDVLAVLLLLPFPMAQVATLPNWMTKAVWLTGAIGLVAIAIALYAAHNQEKMHDWLSAILEQIPFLDKKRWSPHIETLLKGLDRFADWKHAGIIALLSLLIWVPMIAAYWIAMMALSENAHLLIATFGVVAGSLSNAAPSSPGQLGVYEAGVTAALSATEIGRNVAASFAFVFHALYLVTMIGLGIVGLMRTDKSLRNTIEATQEFFSNE